MEIKVNFLDKLRLEAKFDDFTVVADQPIRYKGDGSAPGPFDYFLASSALCAAYFVKLYCETRNIPTDNIRLSQNNIVDPENRYNQIFKIQVELPADISAKDRQGILRSIDRCTVKKVVQTGPEFVIEEVENLDADAQALLTLNAAPGASTFIAGKKGAGARRSIQGQQGLRIGVQVFHFFDHELRAGLHDFFHRATVDRTQDALAVLGRDIGRQLDLDLEDLLVAVFRINDIVLRQADIFGWNIACFAI